MLPVHEDDQDLILGQAAPLSISTHTHTPNQTYYVLLPHQGVVGCRRRVRRADAIAAIARQLLNWFFSDAAVLHSVSKSMQCFKRIDKLCPFL
jgi:hypothetical protein